MSHAVENRFRISAGDESRRRRSAAGTELSADNGDSHSDGQTMMALKAASGFLTSAINRVSDIRTTLQFGFGLMAILAFIIVQFNANSPVLPQIFVFAVVPMLIAMQLVAPLRKTHQFIIVMIISLLTLAFLASGVTLSLRDRTGEYLQTHKDHYAIENTLNQKYLISNKDKMPPIVSYADYRKLILSIYDSDGSDEMINRFDSLVAYHEDYLSCVKRVQCWPSAELNQEVVYFWYTFRPVIEERRLSFWGPSYARSLQERAEALQPPHYLSAVRADSKTGDHVLISTAEQTAGFLGWLRRL